MALKKHQSQTANKSATAKPKAGSKIETLSERLDDMRAHGREVRKSKESAIAFLQRAGILNDSGKLTKPYRA